MPVTRNAHSPAAVIQGSAGQGLIAAYAPRLVRLGRGVALAGTVAVLGLIGILKFTQIEVDALVPLIGGTPWLAWMLPAFGPANSSRLLGIVEVVTALLLAVAPWSPRAAVAGGALAALTFTVTASLLLALPVWEAASGGFPLLNAAGSFLIKDLALLGVALVVAGEGLVRLGGITAADAQR